MLFRSGLKPEPGATPGHEACGKPANPEVANRDVGTPLDEDSHPHPLKRGGVAREPPPVEEGPVPIDCDVAGSHHQVGSERGGGVKREIGDNLPDAGCRSRAGGGNQEEGKDRDENPHSGAEASERVGGVHR